MLEAKPSASRDYVLGDADHELNRLIDQGRFYGDLTEHVLRMAGLGEGMRVLDVGCGAGDVSFLAASVVGHEGSVLGIDKSEEAINLARRRAYDARLNNVEFILHDLNELVLDEPVDALIGRLVLMYFPDPAVVLRSLLASVKPGGIVAFQEHDAAGVTAEPSFPLFEITIQRIKQTFIRTGADVRTGIKLGRIFHEAGLPAPQMIQTARVERGPDSPVYQQLAGITRSLLPVMVRTGVATADEVDIDSLADRLRQETLALDATLVPPPFIGAWTRKPA